MHQYDYEKSARKHLPTLTIDQKYSAERMQVSGHDHHGVDFCESFAQDDWASVCDVFECHLEPNLACALILANLENEIECYMEGFEALNLLGEGKSELMEGVQGIALNYAKQLIAH